MSFKSSAKRSNAEVPPAGYSIDPPMLRFQESLPKLPVPTLQSTAAKYLESVQPLLTPAAFSKTKVAVNEFVQSPLAAELQNRLQARAAEPGCKSWLSEWWNDVAYMGYRDPVVVFVSYFFVHMDDPLRRDAVSRAASLVKAMIPFRDMVESGEIEPEKARGNAPLCMSSYKWLFHSSRYPTKPSDTARKFDSSTHNHIVVIRKNKFFLLPLSTPETPELSYAQLRSQFARIIDMAGPTADPVPIGALTSDNRDKWTDARAVLLAAGSNNAKTLELIESAMIIVTLDDTKPVTREDISWSAWVGDGRNRWFDKHQLMIHENGRSAFLGEHSCMDGTPTLRMNEFLLASIGLNKIPLDPSVDATPVSAPVELKFEINEQVKTLVKDAEGRFDELVGKHDLHVLHYEGYGKNFIKQFRASPDAWAQLVKQLAFHKMFGRPGVTYESAQTRKFQLGRTEVIRAASNESKKWAEAMLDVSETDVNRAKLFREAVTRHLQYASWAADGQGVDRHLFGLKKLLRDGEPTPSIYTDEAFSKSNHWELSTSQLSSNWFDGWGYGEVVEDGYGLAYAIGDDHLRWTITSLKRDTAVLKHYLAEAATEVKGMMERAAKEEAKTQGKAKL